MKPEQAYRAIDTLIEGMDEAERSQLFDRLRDGYPQELGTAALNGAGAEVPAAGEASGLTAEQEEKASKLTGAMAEKFGIPVEDFSVLTVETESGKTQHVVAYTAPNGIDLGTPRKSIDKKRSWDAIFDKKADQDFQVTIDGKKYDSRNGMTWDTYHAFIKDAQARSENPLPDSTQLANQNGEVWTDTWLTGENVDADYAPIAGVGGGQPLRGWGWRGGGGAGGRFRPAVVIE